MFQNINTVGREQHYSAASKIDQISVMVEMPVRFEGRPVSSRAVMISLFWQKYGLDLLHPVFSRWLEHFAPDVKYAVAQNSVKNGVNTGLRVGADGKVKVQLHLEFDQRLREVSAQYKMWQMRPRAEQPRPRAEQPRPRMEQKPSTEQMRPRMEQKPRIGPTRPRMEQKPRMEREEQIATIVYLNRSEVSQNKDSYKLAS
jgi:hypothetical protein